jgi:hypothetical protein
MLRFKGFRQKMPSFSQTTANFCKNLITTLVLRKTPIFCRKLAKIAENCEHNIDPRTPDQSIVTRLGDFSPIG